MPKVLAEAVQPVDGPGMKPPSWDEPGGSMDLRIDAMRRQIADLSAQLDGIFGPEPARGHLSLVPPLPEGDQQHGPS